MRGANRVGLALPGATRATAATTLVHAHPDLRMRAQVFRGPPTLEITPRSAEPSMLNLMVQYTTNVGAQLLLDPNRPAAPSSNGSVPAARRSTISPSPSACRLPECRNVRLPDEGPLLATEKPGRVRRS